MSRLDSPYKSLSTIVQLIFELTCHSRTHVSARITTPHRFDLINRRLNLSIFNKIKLLATLFSNLDFGSRSLFKLTSSFT